MASYPIELNVPQQEAPLGGFGPMPGISAAPIKEAGEAIGRAFGQMGRGLETASQATFGYLQKEAEIQNKTRAADFYLQGADQIGQNNAKLLSLSGSDALEYGKNQYFQNNKDIYNGILSQTTNPMQRMMVADELRRTMAANDEMAYRHLANEEKSYQKKIDILSESHYGNEALKSATANNMPDVYRNLDNAEVQAKNQAGNEGIYGDRADDFARQQLGGHVANVVEGIYRQGGPDAVTRAEDFYHSMRDRIDEKAAGVIDKFLKTGRLELEGGHLGDELYNGAVGRTPAGAGMSSVNSRIDSDFEKKFGTRPPSATAAPTRGFTGRGLTPAVSSVAASAADALRDKGVDLSAHVTSAFRTPEHNAAVGGARGSQHLSGNAIDVSLTGLTTDQRNAVIDQFLSDPRVGGFGYYPHSNSIHVDVRAGVRTAWGTDYTHNTIGAGWPESITEKVRAWQGRGAQGRGSTAAALAEARSAIAAGADRRAVIERFRTNYGVAPEGL